MALVDYYESKLHFFKNNDNFDSPSDEDMDENAETPSDEDEEKSD